MRNVTIRQLQIFAASARLLSFARVAERLHLTPAAVSFQIKQLESMTGFSLFERVGKDTRLTPAGTDLLTYAQIVLQALSDADRAFQALGGFKGARLNIGLVSTAKYIVPHILARFRAEHEGVSINLVDGNRSQIIEAISRGGVDFAIMGEPPAEADVVSHAFARHPSVLIADPSHRLTTLATVTAMDLAGAPLVVREEGSGTRAMFDRMCAKLGVKPVIAMTSSSNETIKQSVMAGMGIALISQHTISLELALGLLRILPAPAFSDPRSWYVAHRRSMPLLPVHSALWQFLIERGQDVIDEMDRKNRAIAARRPQAGD